MTDRVIPSRREQGAGRRFVGRSPFMILKATEWPLSEVAIIHTAAAGGMWDVVDCTTVQRCVGLARGVHHPEPVTRIEGALTGLANGAPVPPPPPTTNPEARSRDPRLPGRDRPPYDGLPGGLYTLLKQRFSFVHQSLQVLASLLVVLSLREPGYLALCIDPLQFGLGGEEQSVPP